LFVREKLGRLVIRIGRRIPRKKLRVNLERIFSVLAWDAD
ncbi:MAG: hypothetical protein JWP51_4039, partial [Bradyrhizobium sp.]|nr:hypothetical protein [Bradyrhizobium sp.]